MLREGDKTGTAPEWPSTREVNNLASATYARLKIAGEWDVPEATKKNAEAGGYTATPGSSQQNKANGGSKPRGKGKCFNCGGEHMLPQCTKP